MTWVIFNINTFKLYTGGDYSGKQYTTERAAKAQYTRLTNTKDMRKRLDPAVWKMTTAAEWQAAEPTVTVYNCLTGSPVQLKASLVGGCCDPSTERYHTM